VHRARQKFRALAIESTDSGAPFDALSSMHFGAPIGPRLPDRSSFWLFAPGGSVKHTKARIHEDEVRFGPQYSWQPSSIAQYVAVAARAAATARLESRSRECVRPRLRTYTVRIRTRSSTTPFIFDERRLVRGRGAFLGDAQSPLEHSSRTDIVVGPSPPTTVDDAFAGQDRFSNAREDSNVRQRSPTMALISQV
jgi:hypothetical protein